jgi:hypothetical protein
MSLFAHLQKPNWRQQYRLFAPVEKSRTDENLKDSD